MKRFFEKVAKARMQSTLLSMGQKWAEDKGYSYEAIVAGESEWPWRKSAEKVVNEKEIRRVIRELKSYNDRELRDIGIPRTDIENAVRYGRPGYEYDTDLAA
jgi:uncharacterized protein YjiS (DUF1127 family)